ncbi:class I SAM-dependent methyltransferase [Lysobacter korlensis]|uniref:Ubiquinone/menaquinone biosynthesis C-methyltransferase UbiE n=1 Tax=Lysobacter korlensis TaxID=553636 RepID=A0ABV6RW72_9GAMM
MNKRVDEIAGMFDGVARRYDRTNTILSLGNAPLWRAATSRAVAPEAGERILDVAAGTGTSSAPLSKAGAVVTAVDISEAMIKIGRTRHAEVDFHVANAERLPFENDMFDAVTISFSLRNIADPRAAVSEMYRVLKPSGRVVICEFSTPPRLLVRSGYRVYRRFAFPAVSWISSNPPAYRYLSESIAHWPDQATLSVWIRAAGFTSVGYRNLSGGIVALHRGRKPAKLVVEASS